MPLPPPPVQKASASSCTLFGSVRSTSCERTDSMKTPFCPLKENASSLFVQSASFCGRSCAAMGERALRPAGARKSRTRAWTLKGPPERLLLRVLPCLNGKATTVVRTPGWNQFRSTSK